jgi:hypothetical protein
MQSISSQSTYVTNTSEYNYFVDRYEILSGSISKNIHTSFKPYKREDVLNLVNQYNADALFNDSTLKVSKADQFNFSYLKDDNWDVSAGSGVSAKPILKHLYAKKNALYAVDNEDFKLVANPILYTSVGKESNSDVKFDYQNTRGTELRGTIDNKISFYTQFTDNQAMLPMYVRSSLRPVDTLKQVLTGENYLKTNAKGRVDYISARGSVNFNITKHIGVQFGHDKNFIGNGYRSLLLSENSGAYNFLKLQTKIWKIQYTNLFCQLTALPMPYDSYFAKKYCSLHHLSTNIGKHFNIGLFESIMYGNRGSGLDINYLNPIIFYRSVEQNLGSSDNAFLGGDWKLNFMKHFSWYGQVMIDEFLIANVRSHNGSWTNKQAIQTGIKYVNVLGIKNLDGQLEYNSVRPYTYAHLDNYRSYSNYLQPLAHPKGANFKELIGILRYQPTGRLLVTGKMIFVKQGIDSLNNTLNAGSNILSNYSKRIYHGSQNYTGHRIGQGVSVNLSYLELSTSYMVKHNVFVDLNVTLRQQTAAFSAFVYNSSFVNVGLRMNFAKKSYDW